MTKGALNHKNVSNWTPVSNRCNFQASKIPLFFFVVVVAMNLASFWPCENVASQCLVTENLDDYT